MTLGPSSDLIGRSTLPTLPRAIHAIPQVAKTTERALNLPQRTVSAKNHIRLVSPKLKRVWVLTIAGRAFFVTQRTPMSRRPTSTSRTHSGAVVPAACLLPFALLSLAGLSRNRRSRQHIKATRCAVSTLYVGRESRNVLAPQSYLLLLEIPAT